MAVGKSQLLDLSATVLEKVAADLRDPAALDTARVTATKDDTLAVFHQKVTVKGQNYLVVIVPDPA